MYGPVLERAKLNNKVNEVIDSIPTKITQAGIPFDINQMTNAGLSSTKGTNLVDDRDKTYNDIAARVLVSHICTTEFADTVTSKQVYNNLREYWVNYKNLDATMFEVMTTIVSEYMSMNGGETMSGDEIEGIISCLDEGTTESIDECVEIFGDVVMNRTSLENFFNNIHQSISK